MALVGVSTTHSSLSSRVLLPFRLPLPKLTTLPSLLLSSIAFLIASSSSMAARLFMVDLLFALVRLAASAAAVAPADTALTSGSRDDRLSDSFVGGDFRGAGLGVGWRIS